MTCESFGTLTFKYFSTRKEFDDACQKDYVPNGTVAYIQDENVTLVKTAQQNFEYLANEGLAAPVVKDPRRSLSSLSFDLGKLVENCRINSSGLYDFKPTVIQKKLKPKPIFCK